MSDKRAHPELVEACGWDDDGFAPSLCHAPEEAHCTLKGVDDSCPLLHHPFKPIEVPWVQVRGRWRALEALVIR